MHIPIYIILIYAIPMTLKKNSYMFTAISLKKTELTSSPNWESQNLVSLTALVPRHPHQILPSPPLNDIVSNKEEK